MKKIGPKDTIPGFRPLIGDERWHVEGLDAKLLDGGYRPLLQDEFSKPGDERRYFDGWVTEIESLSSNAFTFCRTHRPLPEPATPAANDPKGAAGALKAPMWLLPPYALQQTAWVHKHGAAKYLPFNWRETSVCASTYISAIMRHLDDWRDGEDIDPESGFSHIAHIAASCNILLDAMKCGKLQDDRNKIK